MLRNFIRGAAACICAALGPVSIVVMPDMVLADGNEVRRAARAQIESGVTIEPGIIIEAGDGEERDAVDGTTGALSAFLEKTVTLFHATETWSGMGVNAYGWSVYSGVTLAPFGVSGVQADGWRLRVVTALSWRGDPANVLKGHGLKASTDLLLGLHKSLGPLTVKAFLGGSTNGRALAEYTSGIETQGAETGIIGALETWWTISPQYWASVDGSWTGVHSGYSLASRIGYRMSPAISVGGEAALYGNDAGKGGRLGAFTRLEWDYGEVSVGGGITGTNFDKDRAGKSAYGGINWVHRF